MPCDSRVAELLEQRDVAPDPHQEVLSLVHDRPPEVVAHEPGVGAEQRFLRELLGFQHVLKMRSLAGIRRTRPPTPQQPQSHVPHQRQPDLRFDRLRLLLPLGHAVLPTLLRAMLGAATIVRRTKRFLVGSRSGRADPRLIHRQDHQVAHQPFCIAMKLQVLETLLIHDPGHRRPQRLAVDRLFRWTPTTRGLGRPLPPTSLFDEFHLSQTPFKLKRFQFGSTGESGFFHVLQLA